MFASSWMCFAVCSAPPYNRDMSWWCWRERERDPPPIDSGKRTLNVLEDSLYSKHVIILVVTVSGWGVDPIFIYILYLYLHTHIYIYILYIFVSMTLCFLLALGLKTCLSPYEGISVDWHQSATKANVERHGTGLGASWVSLLLPGCHWLDLQNRAKTWAKWWICLGNLKKGCGIMYTSENQCQPNTQGDWVCFSFSTVNYFSYGFVFCRPQVPSLPLDDCFTSCILTYFGLGLVTVTEIMGSHTHTHISTWWGLWFEAGAGKMT